MQKRTRHFFKSLKPSIRRSIRMHSTQSEVLQLWCWRTAADSMAYGCSEPQSRSNPQSCRVSEKVLQKDFDAVPFPWLFPLAKFAQVSTPHLRFFQVCGIPCQGDNLLNLIMRGSTLRKWKEGNKGNRWVRTESFRNSFLEGTPASTSFKLHKLQAASDSCNASKRPGSAKCPPTVPCWQQRRTQPQPPRHLQHQQPTRPTS